ncbi:DUF2617 family protein [Yinghuangia seranimata]|uniref:DUF2617 family protein n=1 Tax=Yinghuangia seranimata TaxID=408067 RepID=UPI00248B6999|nr:DUF2617 family protein [Yinghuangia seranimata]MDI2130800.1 DUF2617 family protein [Yinghuangia seranimata]
MHAELRTAYSDTRADALGWYLGLRPLAPLASRSLTLGGLRLELRLLGASHQVLVHAPHGVCSETVACLGAQRTPLPARAAQRVDGWDYEFTSLVEYLPRDLFASRVRAMVADVEAHPGGIIGAYPGHPDAVTAIAAEYRDGVLSWSTWHTYPQERRIVSTRSRAA